MRPSQVVDNIERLASFTAFDHHGGGNYDNFTNKLSRRIKSRKFGASRRFTMMDDPEFLVNRATVVFIATSCIFTGRRGWPWLSCRWWRFYTPRTTVYNCT